MTTPEERPRDEATPPPAEAASSAAAVGRGGLAVFAAKAYFILIGFVQQTVLRLAIGDASYGALSRVLAPANIIDNVVVTSSIQGVSRAVAGAGDRREEALRAALRIHTPLAFLVAAAFFLASPAYAAFQEAPHIERPLRIAAGVVLLYGLYAPLVGAINGRSLFTKQAALDTIFATLRTVGLVGVGAFFARYVSTGVDGAVTGFVAAALLIVPLALRWAGTGRPSTPEDARSPSVPRPSSYLLALAPLALAQLFANGLMQADIVVLGKFLSKAALASGLEGQAAIESADEWVASYRFCQFFAFLPYQLVLSIAQILFPMVARAHAEGDRASIERYVARGARIAMIACGLFVTVLVAIPGSVLGLAFGAVVAERGAATLRVLVLGQGAFTLFGIGTTVLASLGRERISAALSLVLLAVMSAAVWVASSRAAFGEAQLMATAQSTTATLAVGFFAMALVVKRFAGAFVPLATFLRVAAAVGVAFAVGLRLPRFGMLLTPVIALVAVGAYVLALLAMRELGGEELAALRAKLTRRKRAG